MKIGAYRDLIALWTEYEMGEAKRLRPRSLRTARTLVGLTLAAQGHRIVEAREGYGDLRADLQERYVLLLSPVFQAVKLDAWESAFDAELSRSPVLLVPPDAPACEAEELDKIVGEAEELVRRRVA